MMQCLRSHCPVVGREEGSGFEITKHLVYNIFIALEMKRIVVHRKPFKLFV